MIGEYKFNRNKLIKLLFWILSLLLIANLTVLINKYFLGHSRLLGITRLFNFDAEQNVPTLFSVLLLLLNSLLFYIVYQNRLLPKANGSWRVLSLIFFFLAIDEFSSIHEMLVLPAKALFNASGLFNFAWVIPYGFLLILLFLYMIPLIFRLPKRFLMLYFVSGGIYLGGAFFLEMIDGLYFERHGLDFNYNLLTTAEEFLEMLGLIFCVYTSITFLQTKLEKVSFSITTSL